MSLRGEGLEGVPTATASAQLLGLMGPVDMHGGLTLPPEATAGPARAARRRGTQACRGRWARRRGRGRDEKQLGGWSVPWGHAAAWPSLLQWAPSALTRPSSFPSYPSRGPEQPRGAWARGEPSRPRSPPPWSPGPPHRGLVPATRAARRKQPRPLR